MNEKLVKMMVHRMPDELRWELRQISARTRISMSEIIIDLIRDFVLRENAGRGER